MAKTTQPQGQPPFYLGRDEHGADHWSAGPVVWVGGPATGKTTAYVAPSVRAAAMLGEVSVADAQGDAGRWRWLDYGGSAYEPPTPGGRRLISVAEDRLIDGLSDLPHRPLVIDEFSATVCRLGHRLVPALIQAIRNRHPVGLAILATRDLPPDLLLAILSKAVVVAIGPVSPFSNGPLITAGLGLEGQNLQHGQALLNRPGAKAWMPMNVIGPAQAGGRPRLSYRLPDGQEVVVDFSNRNKAA